MIIPAGVAKTKTKTLVPEEIRQSYYRKSDTVGSALAEFETRYEEACRKAAEAKMRAVARRLAKNTLNSEPTSSSRREADSEVVARAVANARELREMVRKRLRDGYELPFDREIAGRLRKAFREMGLRSDGNPVLKLFVTLIPKAGRARASNDKATLDVQSKSKLLSLDYPYVELNKKFLGALRIDSDGVFHSPGHLLFALEDLVRSGRIPCLPHIITGDLMEDGTYRRPHLIFLLPPGSAVWAAVEDSRCRADILNMFHGVYRGLVNALLELGADPGAPATTMRMKNPISPIWHTLTPNMQFFPALSDYAQWVDTRVSRQELVRKAASIQSKMGITASNELFNILRARAVALLVEWHYSADPRMSGSRAALADHLHVALEDFATRSGMEDTQRSYVIGKVADYLALDFDPTKLQGKKDRKRLMHVVEGMTTVRKRQQAGAEFSNGVRRSRSLEKLMGVYSEMQERGEDLSVERLAMRAGVSRSTAYKHFLACQQNCPIGCIDKKQPATSSVEYNHYVDAEPLRFISGCAVPANSEALRSDTPPHTAEIDLESDDVRSVIVH